MFAFQETVFCATLQVFFYTSEMSRAILTQNIYVRYE